jgi:hypothetical protein
MSYKGSFSIGIALTGICVSSVVSAQTRTVWTEQRPGLQIALNQTWTSQGASFKFSAIRFHLGHFRLQLIDIERFWIQNKQKILASSDERRFSEALVDKGIKAIFDALPQSEFPVAIIPAGWSASLSKVRQVGLLKIGGSVLSEMDDREAMSAVLCLSSPLSEYKNFDYQVPTFYKTHHDSHEKFINACTDAVQVGPRIIEDIGVAEDPRGITTEERAKRPTSRVIFATDNPGRKFPPNNRNRENARNGYFIVAETPVALYDVQEMLLSRTFYGDQSISPHWALNMAGGGASGLIVRPRADAQPIAIGNPSGVIGSALFLKERR